MEKKETCDECGSEQLIEDSITGDCICNECGKVLHEKLQDEGAEWRLFTDGEINSQGDRCGNSASSLLSSSSSALATAIVPSHGAGKLIATHQQHAITKTDRSLLTFANEVKEALEHLGANQRVIDCAQTIAADAFRNKNIGWPVLRRRKRMFVGAISYVAFRLQNCPRPLRAITATLSLSKKGFTHCINLLKDNLDLELIPLTPSNLMHYYCAQLDLPTRLENLAIEISDNACKKNLTYERKPTTLCAACISFAGEYFEDIDVAEERLCDAIGVTVETLNRLLSHMKKYRTALLEGVYFEDILWGECR